MNEGLSEISFSDAIIGDEPDEAERAEVGNGKTD
jgi:hypothetical protein